MKKTKTTEKTELENELNKSDVIESSNPVEVKLEVKAKLELTPQEEKVLYWHNKGQSVKWIAGALMLTQDRVTQIINKA